MIGKSFLRKFKSGRTDPITQVQFKQASVEQDLDGLLILKCSSCGVELSKATQHEDREHFCSICMSGKCCTRFTKC